MYVPEFAVYDEKKLGPVVLVTLTACHTAT